MISQELSLKLGETLLGLYPTIINTLVIYVRVVIASIKLHNNIEPNYRLQ